MMRTLYERAVFTAFIVLWGITWIPLTILFVTVWVPLNSAQDYILRKDPRSALLSVISAYWPLWAALLIKY